MDRMAAIFQLPKDAVTFYSSSNKMQLALRIQQTLNGPQATVHWPKLFLHVNTLTLSEQGTDSSYPYKQLVRRGINYQVADSENVMRNVSIVPATFTIEATFMTDDFFEALRFGKQWLIATAKNAFNFTINYGSASLDIRAQGDNTVSTPDRDEAVNHPNVYEYTATVSFWGYVSDTEDRQIPVLRQQVSTITESAIVQSLAEPTFFPIQ